MIHPISTDAVQSSPSTQATTAAAPVTPSKFAGALHTASVRQAKDATPGDGANPAMPKPGAATDTATAPAAGRAKRDSKRSSKHDATPQDQSVVVGLSVTAPVVSAKLDEDSGDASAAHGHVAYGDAATLDATVKATGAGVRDGKAVVSLKTAVAADGATQDGGQTRVQAPLVRGPESTAPEGAAARSFDRRSPAGQSIQRATSQSAGVVAQRDVTRSGNAPQTKPSSASKTGSDNGYSAAVARDKSQDTLTQLLTVTASSPTQPATSGTVAQAMAPVHAAGGATPSTAPALTAAATTDALPAAVGSGAWSHQISQQVVQMVQQGPHDVQLQLHPASLGLLAVHLHMDGSSVQVSFVTQQAQVVQAVQQALPTLRDALAGAGAQLGNAWVGQQGQGRGGGSMRQSGRSLSVGSVVAGAPSAAAVVSGSTRELAAGGVDLYA